MNSSYICLACRRTVGRTRLHEVVQWHPRASFISLSNTPPTTTEEESRQDISNLDNLEDGKKGRYIGVGAIPERRRRTPRQSYNAGDELETLFEESVKQPRSEVKEIPVFRSVNLYIQADNLRKMLADDGCAIGDTWKLFVEHFGPEVWKNGTISQRTSPQYMDHVKKTLARRLLKAKREDPWSPDLPTVTEFSKVYSQLGVLHCQEWVDMMLVLLENLIKLEQSSENSELVGRAISDILGSWNVVYRYASKIHAYPSEGSLYDWSHIPNFDVDAAVERYRGRGTQGLFRVFAPTFELRSQYNIALVAVVTFALLTKSSFMYNVEVQQALPLLSALGAAINTCGFDVEKIKINSPEGIPQSILDFIRVAGPEVKETAYKMQLTPVPNGSGPKSWSESRSSIKFASMTDSKLRSSKLRTDISSMGKRIFDAMHRRDLPQVKKLWSDASQFPIAKSSPETDQDDESRSSTTFQRGTLTPELCNYFVMIYMALRQPGLAIGVWNHMIKSGLFPNLKTWDSMLTGCRTCRDPKALEDVWMGMIHLGVQPDVVCWTTRITGLIDCNKVDKAMHALDDMGRIWLAANEPKPDVIQKKETKMPVVQALATIQPVKPTIETVNAAVAALLRKRLPEAAHRVLTWSARFNITPNVITYNTLLMPLIRDGHRQDAMALLKQMQKEGIDADVGTFTTILDDILGSDGITPEEQQAITSNLLSEMENAGVKANLHTYGKMIYQLLQNPSGDMTVVNVIMERMVGQGIQPTAYIFTMILTHYFSLDPPDLDAVRNLIERVKDEVGSVDHKFWDRVIEGYARAGDTASAMRTLGKHEGKGNRASWVTKQVLLTALVQNEEWTVARSFVGNVKADSGGPSPGMKNQEGQQRFWRLAAELELL